MIPKYKHYYGRVGAQLLPYQQQTDVNKLIKKYSHAKRNPTSDIWRKEKKQDERLGKV